MKFTLPPVVRVLLDDGTVAEAAPPARDAHVSAGTVDVSVEARCPVCAAPIHGAARPGVDLQLLRPTPLAVRCGW